MASTAIQGVAAFVTIYNIVAGKTTEDVVPHTTDDTVVGRITGKGIITISEGKGRHALDLFNVPVSTVSEPNLLYGIGSIAVILEVAGNRYLVRGVFE